MKNPINIFRSHLSLVGFAGILILSLGSLLAAHPINRSESWSGLIETAGLWGGMQLKLSQQEANPWKGDATFNIAGNEQAHHISEFKVIGSEVSFSTELQAMEIHFILRFSGKRYGNALRGSFAAIRSDGTVTSGTWELQSQEGSRPTERIPVLPTPTGSYAIGRTSFDWRDSSRPEVMTDDPKDFREVMVHVWYPAEHPLGASGADYLPDLELFKTFYPESRLAILGSLRSHAVADAAIASGRNPFPVVIFSPGGGVSAYFYSAVVEELASHGYIVAAIDHTFESQQVVFPNKRIVSYNESQVKDGLRFSRERIEVRAADASFVIDQLAKLNANPTMFRGRINLTRIGIFGHSRGGLAAPMACQRDGRFKACLNMDGNTLGGPFYPDSVPKQPFMWFGRFKPDLSDEQLLSLKMTRPQWDQNLDRIYSRVNGSFHKVGSGGYRVTLNRAIHLTFSDVPSFAPNIDLDTLAFRFRMLRIVRNYTLAFFDKHLRNQNPQLLKGPATDYPEIQVERFEPHSR